MPTEKEKLVVVIIKGCERAIEETNAEIRKMELPIRVFGFSTILDAQGFLEKEDTEASLVFLNPVSLLIDEEPSFEAVLAKAKEVRERGIKAPMAIVLPTYSDSGYGLASNRNMMFCLQRFQFVELNIICKEMTLGTAPSLWNIRAALATLPCK